MANAKVGEPKTLSERIQSALQDADLAFWSVIAEEFRDEIKTGDFPPDAVFEFHEAQKKAVKFWVGNNLTDGLVYIKERIELQIEKLSENNDDYWGSEQAIIEENEIFDSIKKSTGWDWNNDDEAIEYFDKATSVEIMQYLISTVLPKLKAGKKA